MEEVSKDQIMCIFDSDNSTPIFDKDDQNSQQSSVDTQKFIPLQQNSKADFQMISKVREEIEKSRDNFFKVNLYKRSTENLFKKSTETPLIDKGLNSNQKITNIKSFKLPKINQQNKNSILTEGYVNKKTEGFFSKWNKRYLVLTSEKLYFFTDDKKYEVSACINIKLLPIKINQKDDYLVLDFAGQCQNIVLKPCDEKELKKWKQVLEQVINYQAKENKVMIKTLVKPIYDSKDTIAQKNFIQTAQTGDVLLFYTKNTGAQLQRFLTNSDFDHVAMAVKFGKNDLMVFESNQMYGVSIYNWRQYIQYFDLYQKITIRKLQYIKKADVQRELLNFVNKNLGKNYQINFKKLVTMESDVNWDMINQEKNKQRGYFCSELIAKALKSVGLLDEKKSSTRYWPVDFAEKSGLLFKKGAFLGKEQVIILNKHLKNYV